MFGYRHLLPYRRKPDLWKGLPDQSMTLVQALRWLGYTVVGPR